MPKTDCEKILQTFTGMQHEDLIKLHGKTRYKKGAHKVEEPNPEHDSFPGYGNKRDVLNETLPAARCLEVTLTRLREHAAEHILDYKFYSIPDKKGDPPVAYADEAAFTTFIDSCPEPTDDDDADDDGKIEPTWREQVDARLSAIEAKLGI